MVCCRFDISREFIFVCVMFDISRVFLQCVVGLIYPGSSYGVLQV